MTEEKKAKGFVDIFHRCGEKIAVKNRFFVKFSYHFNKKMTLDEFKMVDLPDGSRFLCVGCGSLPWTLLILGKAKNWKFVGIDLDFDAVKNAKKMIKYFNLSDKITIEKADGLTYDMSKFDIITIAFGVNPRWAMLENIKKSIKNDALVLYRSTWDSLDKIYGQDSIPGGYKIINVFNRIDGVKSILLKKVENNK